MNFSLVHSFGYYWTFREYITLNNIGLFVVIYLWIILDFSWVNSFGRSGKLGGMTV